MWVFVGLLLTFPEPSFSALSHPGQLHLDLWEARVAATLATTWDGGQAVKRIKRLTGESLEVSMTQTSTYSWKLGHLCFV